MLTIKVYSLSERRLSEANFAKSGWDISYRSLLLYVFLSYLHMLLSQTALILYLLIYFILYNVFSYCVFDNKHLIKSWIWLKRLWRCESVFPRPLFTVVCTLKANVQYNVLIFTLSSCFQCTYLCFTAAHYLILHVNLTTHGHSDSRLRHLPRSPACSRAERH